MSQNGANLQLYNNELVVKIETLRQKRDELSKQISDEDEVKAQVQRELRLLTEKLARINDVLQQKTQLKEHIEQTLKETETAYLKIIQSSHELLEALNKESDMLNRKLPAVSL